MQNSDLPDRKPNRLKSYDYSQNGCYFITICVKDRREMLGNVLDGQIILSKYGRTVKREIDNISAIRKECIVENFVVMPNHIHMIVRITDVGDDGNRPAEPRSDCHPPLRESIPNDVGDDGNRPAEPRSDCHPPLRESIPNMVQGFKGAVTRQIGFSLWQRSFHDHIIRNNADYLDIWKYIDENPVKWDEDCFYPK